MGNSIPRETGRVNISWETYSLVIDTRCVGCEDLFYIGEEVALLETHKFSLRFHENCLEQVTGILATFLDASEDARNRIIARQN